MSKLPPLYPSVLSHEAGSAKTLPDPDTASAEASVELTPDELDSVTAEVIALLDSVYDPNLQDPLLYIQSCIQEMVNDSSASDELKHRIDSSTPIAVGFRQPSTSSGLIDGSFLFAPLQKRNFPLADIVTDSYRRELTDHLQVQVLWPVDFPQDLIDALQTANLQASYQADVQRRLNTPQAKSLMKLQAAIEVESRLEKYANRAETPEVYKQLARAYLRQELTLDLVEFRSRVTRRHVAQMLYLQPGNESQAGGLLIFLDATEDDAIMPLPLTARRWIIESSPRLRRLVLQRLPLYQQLKSDNQKLLYQLDFMGPLVTRVSPLQFHQVDDVFETLYTLKLERMLSDIDTLVSTDTERLSDQLLEIGVLIFQGLAIAVTLPSGGGSALAARLLVSFLLGHGAAALEAVRGANADTPQETEAHYKAALLATITEVAGPLAQKLLGRALSTLTKSRIGHRLFKHVLNTRPYPGKPVALGNTIRPDPADVKRVKAEVIRSFSQGPERAQELVAGSARLLNRTVEGHDLVIYRGKVFRGDMRPPEVIFDKGFELRTPAAEIQKDIHQVTGVRGGFGGGHDALDLDGKGISTSAFYYKDNIGAFVYGGQKGGYTYLIDGRKLDGYHLYQNHHNALYPNATKPIHFKPSEINYAENIPPTVVLGAYDPLGNFIPNNLALKKYAREIAKKEIRERLAAAAAAAAAAAITAGTPGAQDT